MELINVDNLLKHLKWSEALLKAGTHNIEEGINNGLIPLKRQYRDFAVDGPYKESSKEELLLLLGQGRASGQTIGYLWDKDNNTIYQVLGGVHSDNAENKIKDAMSWYLKNQYAY